MSALTEFFAEFAAFSSVLAPPAFIRQQAAWQPVPGLRHVENVDLKSGIYTNQSEPGGALAAGSNSGGGGNAAFFMR
jgi:hypothetical protein